MSWTANRDRCFDEHDCRRTSTTWALAEHVRCKGERAVRSRALDERQAGTTLIRGDYDITN